MAAPLLKSEPQHAPAGLLPNFKPPCVLQASCFEPHNLACAAGLLLNNLSVFRGCDIVFDSADVPEDAVVDGAGALPDMQVSHP